MPVYIDGEEVDIPPNTILRTKLNEKTGDYDVISFIRYVKGNVVEIPASEARHRLWRKEELSEEQAKMDEEAFEMFYEKPKRTCSFCTIC